MILTLSAQPCFYKCKGCCGKELKGSPMLSQVAFQARIAKILQELQRRYGV
jgi:hypothetical protein